MEKSFILISNMNKAGKYGVLSFSLWFPIFLFDAVFCIQYTETTASSKDCSFSDSTLELHMLNQIKCEWLKYLFNFTTNMNMFRPNWLLIQCNV